MPRLTRSTPHLTHAAPEVLVDDTRDPMTHTRTDVTEVTFRLVGPPVDAGP
jgi:hypothetical protein